MEPARIQTALNTIREQFLAAADPTIADDMARYMKHVSIFIGLKAPERREILKPIFVQLKGLSEAELLQLVDGLYALPEREFTYAACDALARFNKVVPPEWLDTHIKRWLLDKPWWDTVDSLGSAVISPLTARHPELEPVMRSWLGSDEMWLQRAAIGHQRGRRDGTDVPLLLNYLSEVAHDRRFFIAKAVGWALRDLAAIDLSATENFLTAHPDLPAVARREAVRGIERTKRSGMMKA